MKYLRWIFLSLFFVLLFAEVWLGFPADLQFTSAASSDKEWSDQNPTSAADKRMQGVHYAQSRSGNRDWELFAENAESVPVASAAESTAPASEWDLKKVKVFFYSKDKAEFTVTGDSGRIDSKTKDMRIAGHVVILSKNGYHVLTDTVVYQSQDRLIRSVDKVRLLGPADENGAAIEVQGDFLEVRIDQSLIHIKDHVVAKKSLHDGKAFSIHSNNADFYGNQHTVRFYDQVSIDMNSIKLEGPEAQFQYGQTQDILKNIVVKGGVKVSDLDKYATSESVNFDPELNRFTLQGTPRVVQNNDEITGDRIVLLDGGKRVKVENMKAHVEKLED